jgi:Flp pilus assembly protein TadG
VAPAFGNNRQDEPDENRMNVRAAFSSRRDDSGAVTIIVALLTVILLAVTALAVDIGRLTYERQKLRNTLDAAAQAGSYELPSNGAIAQAKALEFATANDPNSHPTVTLWCVVASAVSGGSPTNGGGTAIVAANVVGPTCYPGAGPYTVANYPGLKCGTKLCSIPCPATTGVTCNAITVKENRAVPFYFAPILGILSGNTGSVVSSSCKGACGTPPTNSMDVVVVADRTGSMSTADRTAMTTAIKGMLQMMTPVVQYVGFGTIGKSMPGACLTTGATSVTQVGSAWIPIAFTNDYVTMGATAPPYALNTSSNLIAGLNCLAASSTGTWLASPLKSAARYLLGLDANNIGSLPSRSGTVRRAIIFETDGEPNETALAGSSDLNTAGDIGNANGDVACTNLLSLANQAKAQGVMIITVAFGTANTAYCSGGASGTRVRDVLAGVASNDPRGGPSLAGNCGTAAEILTENTDGDYYYCAATGTDLAPLFVTALGQLNSHSRFMALP